MMNPCFSSQVSSITADVKYDLDLVTRAQVVSPSRGARSDL